MRTTNPSPLRSTEVTAADADTLRVTGDLSIWFLCFVLSLMGADYATATEAVTKPWNAVLLVGFLVAMFWHAQLGLQVVLEDYIHNSLLALALQVTVKFVAVLGAIVSIFAVARIALGN